MQQIHKRVVQQAHMAGAATPRPETQSKSVLLDFKSAPRTPTIGKVTVSSHAIPIDHMVQYRPLYTNAQSPQQAFPLNIWLGVGLQGYAHPPLQV